MTKSRVTKIFAIIATTLIAVSLPLPSANAWTDTNISVSTFRGTSDEGCSDIAVDRNGNIYATGKFFGTVDFDPGSGETNLTSSGSSDSYISKLDASGNFIWAKKIGGPSSDVSESIAIDSEGNILITGSFYSTIDSNPGAETSNISSSGGKDIFIVKLDSSGSFLWSKKMGDTADDVSYSITTDRLGNIYTTGSFYGSVDFDPGDGNATLRAADQNDVFVSKLDSSGNFVWAKNFGGSASDEGRSIAVDGSGNVVTTGYFVGTADFDPGAGTLSLSSKGFTNIFISKLDPSGNFLWAKSFGSAGNNFDSAEAITIDANGNIFSTGKFFSTVDFDPGSGETNLTSSGSSDVYISKLDTSGNFLWVKSLGGSSGDYANDITLDSSGNIYTTGFFAGTPDFDPGMASSFNLTSSGSFDVFISKLDPSGNYLWARKIGGAGWDLASSITTDSNDNVLVAGYFARTADFDPSDGSANLTSAGGDDAFILRLNPSGSAESVAASISSLSTNTSSSNSNSSAASADAAEAAAKAAAQAAAAKREAEKRDARTEIVRKAIDKETLSIDLFDKADIPGITAGNLARAEAEIHALSDSSRSELSQILKIARKYEVVGLIGSNRVKSVYANQYIEIGLISADSKIKSTLAKAVRGLAENERSSYEAIKAAIEAKTAEIQVRNDRLAKVLAWSTTRNGK